MGMKLRGQVAVITGAGSGIGYAIAQRFADEGAHVAIAEVNPETGEAAAAALRGDGYVASFYPTDVTNRASVQAMVEATLRDHGRIDILVNNAGIAIIGPSETFSEQDWRTSIEVMQTGVFFCSQAIGQVMIRQKAGNIVNVSSINGFAAFPERLAYCAAKAAVIMMTKVLAIEWAEHNIRVNAVAPGVTKTPLVAKVIASGIVREEMYTNRTPMRRLARPEEIARAVLYLASDDSSFVTGEVLTVDGGWTAYQYV